MKINVFLAQMQRVVTKYQTTAKCSYKYTLTISSLNINGSWNNHQILIQNISILSLRILRSFFTSSANTLLILRSSQDMAGFCVWFLYVFFTEVIQGHCSHEDGMQCLLTFLEKNLPYSYTAVKFYKLKSSHQITWCKSYWFPATGRTEKIPWNLKLYKQYNKFLSPLYRLQVFSSWIVFVHKCDWISWHDVLWPEFDSCAPSSNQDVTWQSLAIQQQEYSACTGRQVLESCEGHNSSKALCSQ